MTLPFWKMHGLGNDFVVVDARIENFNLTPEQIVRVADRKRGVGFDQMLVIGKPESKNADAFMHVINSDGTSDTICGNGTRCVAAFLMNEAGSDTATIETLAGDLHVVRDGDLIKVDMGTPLFEPAQIPYTGSDTLNAELIEDFPTAVIVNVGNPHTVFFVDNADTVPLSEIGPRIENDPRFPKRTNVEFCHIIAPDKIRMRVWERGTGITEACGSGACSVMVAAFRRGLVGRKAEIILDGGSLFIELTEQNRVLMTGPAAFVFSGMLDAELIG